MRDRQVFFLFLQTEVYDGLLNPNKKAGLLSRGLMDRNKDPVLVCVVSQVSIFPRKTKDHGTAALRSCAGFCRGALSEAGLNHVQLCNFIPSILIFLVESSRTIYMLLVSKF